MLATIYDPNWYLNSEVTHQMTPNSSHLLDQVPYNGSKQVWVGNGDSLHIKNIGSSIFKPFSSRHSLKLEKIFNVPHLTKNLLSVSQFARDNDVFFKFHPNTCYVKSQASKETLLQWIISNGLYSFGPIQSSSTLSSTANLVLVKRTSHFKLWHLWLEHPSAEVVTRVLKSCNLPFSILDSVCFSCCIGKS